MLWNNLGYTQNIYFVTPLTIDDLGKRLLYGREDEIQAFLVDCLNDKRCLKAIGGDVGVGKTSFVNVAQYICYKVDYPEGKDPRPQYLPSFKKIELSNHDNLNSFSVKATRTLAINIESHYSKIGSEIPRLLKDSIDFWTKAKLIISEGGTGLGIDILGMGGEYTTQHPTYTYQDPKDPVYAFNDMLKRFLEESDISGVFLLIDNLDRVDKSCLINILDEIRDSFFTLEHVYWILVGQRGIGTIIQEKSRRLGGYLTGSEISLERLSPRAYYSAVEERGSACKISDPILLKQYLEERSKRLRRKIVERDIMLPLDYETHMMTYQFAHLELREAFRLCHDITVRAQEQILAHGTLDGDTALNYLIEFCDKEASLVDLSKESIHVLSKIYLDDGVSNSSFQLYNYRSAAGFESLLRNFFNKGLLKRTEERKTNKYDPTWRLESMAICNLLGQECHEKAFSKLTEGRSI